MADDLPSPGKGIYLFFEFIAFSFVLGAVEEFLRNRSAWHVWLGALAFAAIFLFLGVMGPKMRTTLYGFIASMRTPKALVAARAENADLVVQLREARAQTAEEADKAVKTHLMLSERDRQESVFLKTKLSNLEHDLELRDRELSTLRRQLTAIYPFVIPVEYGIQDKPAKQQRWTGLLLSNDGGRVAYDVEMIPFKVGKWTVTLEPVLRMELGQKTPAFLDVRCDTVGESDLLRHIAEFQRAADSLGEPIPFEIRYRDADWNRFTSFCEFRIVAAFGLTVRCVRREEMTAS